MSTAKAPAWEEHARGVLREAGHKRGGARDAVIDVLADEGRLVVIGMQGGIKAELDLNMLMRKRGAVISTSLRGRPVGEKATICAAVAEHVWPLVTDGTIRPIIERTMPLADAAGAHALMESGDHTGKIVLVTGDH